MRILALQLKRIGDLVLTAPALAALRRERPGDFIALAASGAAAELLPAFPSIDTGIVFGPGRGWAPWQQVLTGGFDLVLDFTGTDRSALATLLSRAPERRTFEWVKSKGLRARAYNRFIDSSVRERHTVDHYADLVELPPGNPTLQVPSAAIDEPFAIVHPGTARVEKFWLPERWSEVIAHLEGAHGLKVVVTGGTGPEERAHLAEIPSAPVVTGDLLTLATLARQARLVVSCDTAIVHLAAAFETPQIALFGPTNPFHWRPRHPHARVLSAAQPDAPLTAFEPRMKGAPMERISTALAIRAIDDLLASPR